jgi:hypothetical protein
MFAKKAVVVAAGVAAVVFGFAVSTLAPGPQTPIGLLGSAFGGFGPAHAASDIETVEGEVSGYKYSPSGRHINGFYLGGNGIFRGGRTAVILPPHAASMMPPEGASVEVSGVLRENPLGGAEIHATSITDGETGKTLALESPATMEAPPPGDPGFAYPGFGPEGKGAQEAAPPPSG